MNQEFYVYNKKDAKAGLMSGCILWWKPNGAGYTRDLRHAGKYTMEDHDAGYPNPSLCVYVPCEEAEKRSYHERIVFVEDLPQPKTLKKEPKHDIQRSPRHA